MKLKIVSYNIHKGFTFSNRRFILDHMRTALRELDADILFLQEVMGEHSEDRFKIPLWNNNIQFEYLAESFWPHFTYGKNAVYSNGHHGNAILSKFPILEWSNIVISENRPEPRGLLTAKIKIPETGQEMILANTHLDHLQQEGRYLQTDMIVRELSKESDYPWLLVGDFNDWNKKLSPIIEKKLNAIEAYKFLHGKLPLIFPSFMPFMPLDRVYLHKLKPTKAMRLIGPEWKKLSDHLPMLIEVELPDAA